MTTFITLRGQYDNVGDVILRRQLARWFDGPCVVYVGDAPAEFVDALQLGSKSVMYSFPKFVQSIITAPSGSSYVFKPGETQLTLAGMKENIGMVPMLAKLRVRGGSVLRIGVGARGSSSIYSALCKPSIKISNLNQWRDPHTLAVLGGGQIMPDLAFAEGSHIDKWTGERTVIAVSLRGDRPLPGRAWISALKRCADARSANLVVVSQVRRDDQRSIWLAGQLGVEAVLCGVKPCAAIEEDLRRLYRRCALVVSNRLHVLIAALTEGAPVSGCVPGGSQKIAEHLDVVGLGHVAVNSDRISEAECLARLTSEVPTRRQLVSAVMDARRQILQVRKQVNDLISGDAVEAGSEQEARS